MKLSKKTILSEMIVFKEGDDYIAKHPDWDYVVGVGDTPEEAVQIFKEMLPDALSDLKADKWHLNSKPKAGRPPLGRETFNTKIKPDIKDFLKKAAKANKISAGEFIERVITLQFENVPNPQRRKGDALFLNNTKDVWMT